MDIFIGIIIGLFLFGLAVVFILYAVGDEEVALLMRHHTLDPDQKVTILNEYTDAFGNVYYEVDTHEWGIHKIVPKEDIKIVRRLRK